MKIKLAILEKDTSYLGRFVNVFSTKYADKIEIYSFTELEKAVETLASTKIDVFLCSDLFDVDFSTIPTRCAFAYFIESTDVETLNEKRVICKFQKIDQIYKQILSLYSEIAGNVSDSKIDDGFTKVIAFTSPSGGVGCSSLAAACAIYFATRGKKTLYLNLERFGSADRFFAAEGQFDMSDVIFAIKSKKANLAMKLESSVKVDPRGVCFFSESKSAMDMLELKNEECMHLIKELKISGSYEYIILDVDFLVGKDMLALYHQAETMVWVGDGSEVSNGKIARAHEVLTNIEQSMEVPLASKMALIYNKFSSKTSQLLNGINIRNVGGVPRFEHATTQQVITQLASMEIFSDILG